MSRQVLLLTDLVNHLLLVETSTGEQSLTQHRLSIEPMPVRPLLFDLCFYHFLSSLSSPSTGFFFSNNIQTVTVEVEISFCCSSTMADLI